jgi:hypothetical protein
VEVVGGGGQQTRDISWRRRQKKYREDGSLPEAKRVEGGSNATDAAAANDFTLFIIKFPALTLVREIGRVADE